MSTTSFRMSGPPQNVILTYDVIYVSNLIRAVNGDKSNSRTMLQVQLGDRKVALKLSEIVL